MSYLENNQLPPAEVKDIDESEDFLNQRFDKNHFITTAVKGYMRTSLFWCVAVALCAMRAASPEAVFVAYFSLLFRIIQLVALYTQNKKIAKCAYVVSTLSICILFMAAISKDEADIIHESVPTKD